MTVGQIIGWLAFGAVAGFSALYSRARHQERRTSDSAADRTPEIAANAVGAAFVDRSAAQALIEIRGDVGSILELLEEKKEHDDEDRIVARTVLELRGEMVKPE